MENYLRKNGPVLSKELIKYLVKNNKITQETARKRLSRLRLPITKVKGLFSDNQALYHLQEQYKQDEFYHALLEAFKASGHKYYVIIKAIEFHYGYLSITELPSYSFSPIQNLKGHKRLDNILGELVRLNVIFEENGYYKLHSSISTNTNFNYYKAIETASNFLLFQFKEWASKIGITSYSTAKFHSQFGKFSWSFVSPSYVSTLTSYNGNKIKPAFVVCDVVIGQKIDHNTVNFFIQKVAILKQLKGLPKFLPFLIVDELEIDTLKLLKSKGIIIGFVNQLFGKDYKELLKSLINMITNAGAILKKNPNSFLGLISKLNKLIDGKTNNLRGDLFELAVGFYHSKSCNSIDISKIINFDGRMAEVDVFALYSNKIVVAECKGYKSKINKDDVEEWISEKIPLIRKWILRQNYLVNKEIVFEYWSSGGYSPDALKIIKNNKTKKYKIEFIDEKDLLIKANELGSKKFNAILKDYFLKEI